MYRWQFSKLTGGGALSALIPSRALWEMKKVDKIGVQLYTLRDAKPEDPIGTLKVI